MTTPGCRLCIDCEIGLSYAKYKSTQSFGFHSSLVVFGNNLRRKSFPHFRGHYALVTMPKHGRDTDTDDDVHVDYERVDVKVEISDDD